MILGRINYIDSTKKLFSVKLEDDEYSIIEYYDDKDISFDDLILGVNMLRCFY